MVSAVDPDAAESYDDHEKARNAGRLKYGSLLIARPATHAGPDNSDNSREPGSSADHPVENAYSPIRGASCLFHIRQLRPREIIETEKHQQQPHADPEINR